MDGSHFFEGPEKLMEIWWKPLESGRAEIAQNGTDVSEQQKSPTVNNTSRSGDLRTITR